MSSRKSPPRATPPTPSDLGRVTLDPAQRARLAAAKLNALVRDIDEAQVLGEVDEMGSSWVATTSSGVVMLLESSTPAAVAGAVLAGIRRDADVLTLFVDDDADVAARFASYFSVGGNDIVVRAVDGASSKVAVPAPLPVPAAAVDVPADLLAQLNDAGVEVVDEHGHIRGEVLGLEVARLVEWPTERGGDGELHLEAGVGRFDRDAVAAAHPDEVPAEALARTVARISEHRYDGAPAHPTQMLARSRWLRAAAIAAPAVVDAASLTAVGMTTEPGGIKEQHPAAAVGLRGDGTAVVAVFSSGVDLALVPLAADTRAMLDGDAALVVAVPQRDLHPATVQLVSALRSPAELLALDEPWS